MPKKSAGLLLYRFNDSILEVLLVHPGGPFWRNKDERAWTIPKGEFDDEEDPLAAACREFAEETGTAPPRLQRDASGGENYFKLAPVKQTNGKMVHAWAVEGDFDPRKLSSNQFQMEWPPRSGRMQSFPEVDRAEWFTADLALKKIVKAQTALIAELLTMLTAR